MARNEEANVLDHALLECLAVLAAANGRSVVEELNIAVKAYVLQEFAEHGQDTLVERALSERPVSIRP